MNEKISKAIRLMRQAREWSVRDLARESGVSEAHLYAIEAGRNSCGTDRLQKVAAAFGIEMSQLIALAEQYESRRAQVIQILTPAVELEAPCQL